MAEPEVVRAIKEANSSLNHSLEGLKTDVRKSNTLLDKIIGFFTQLQKTIEEGFSRIMQNQSLIVLIAKTSDLNRFAISLRNNKASLSKKKQYCVEDLGKLQKRYNELNDALSSNADTTIYNLTNILLI